MVKIIKAAAIAFVCVGLAFAVSYAADRTGKDVFEAKCRMCHGTGVMGAPKLGDTAAWAAAEKASGGVKGLEANAIKGKNRMPAKGGCGDCSEGEIKGAVKFMVDSAKPKK